LSEQHSHGYQEWALAPWFQRITVTSSNINTASKTNLRRNTPGIERNMGASLSLLIG
jgi:hypothetical protein